MMRCKIVCGMLLYVVGSCPNHTCIPCAGAVGKSTIRCMSLEDSSLVAARQAVTEVLHLNQTSAENLAGLFDQYLYLLTDDTEALLLKFALQAEPPSVEQYEEHLSMCQTAVETIRYSVSLFALFDRIQATMSAPLSPTIPQQQQSL